VNQTAAMDKIELAVFKKQKESFNVHSVVICESDGCDGPNPLKNKKRASMCTMSSSMTRAQMCTMLSSMNQTAVMDTILSR
jgi:hypothetical protein